MRSLLSALLALGLAACLDPGPAVTSQRSASTSRAATDLVPGELIVKLHAPLATRRLETAGYSLAPIEPIGAGMWLMRIEHGPVQDDTLGEQTTAHETSKPTLDALTRAAAVAVSADARVEYAHENWILHPSQVFAPSDPLLADQSWQHQAIRLRPAWDIIHAAGGGGVRLAIIDSGTTPHPDITWGAGWNFSGSLIGNDQVQNALPYHHGVAVAGVAGARANGQGGVGVCWSCEIIPIRTTGAISSNGDVSKVARAILWAAGYDGQVPGGPRRADVINISMNSLSQSCPGALQTAIDSARDEGISVVVSAGHAPNNGIGSTPGTPWFPADCQGVIVVAASDRQGRLATYSLRGPTVDVVAPGGGLHGPNNSLFGASVGAPTCLVRSRDVSNYSGVDGVVAPWTVHTGNPQPADHCHRSISGTSFAAPHVTGVIGLMLSVNPQLTPDQVEQFLRATARPDRVDCSAAVGGCGGGLIDAHAAVLAAQAGEVPGGVEVTPAAIGFPPTRVTTSAATSLQLRNPGAAPRTVTVSASDAQLQLSCTSAGCSCAQPTSCTVTVSGLQSTNLTVLFVPTTEGPFSANLTVSPSAPGGPEHTIPVNGTATFSRVGVFPGMFDFDKVRVGSSRDLSVHLTNVGSASLVLSPPALTGDPSFTLLNAPTAPLTLAPGAWVVLSLRCAPTSAGTKRASLPITTNANVPVAPVSARCIAYAPEAQLTVQSPGPALGSVPIGTTVSRQLTVDISSLVSGEPFSINRPAPPFSLTCLSNRCTCGPTACSGTTAIGPEVLLLSFTPTVPGNASTTLTLTSNDPDPRPSVVFTGAAMP